jgi:uracil-DNA glycosylase
MNSMNDRSVMLNHLHSRLSECRLCLEAGYDIFPRAILSGGMGARIMTIGQAPGITEKDAGRPFNAGSGSRLFKWLAEAGIEENWFRATQYMSSVTKCYPGRTNSGSGDRVPSHAEQKLCRPYLDEEITLINPELIIPIGRLAIGLYYPKGLALTKIIGTQKQIDDRWIVPLPHPSGASRWHQEEANRALIQKAITLIQEYKRQIYT